MVMTAALRTGGPARINGERLAKGPFGAIVGRLGLRAAVATPVVVGGRYWGVMVAATSREDFAADTESRMAEFMELAGMAIANAEAEQKLRGLADTQASLRRLAMLVARGEAPDTEQRMTEFTELVATAVANAQSRAELITSRARIIAASDEARRRIERDLHDGAQQRLVTLALRLRSAAEPPSGRGELGADRWRRCGAHGRDR
jgi:GAF domain-containing protein